MNEETTNVTNDKEHTEYEGKSQAGKKLLPIIIAAVVILTALAVGIGIYNTPANRLQRQLDLGNKYLEEQQYEQAAIAFEEAIAIDDRCMEAYTGGIEAYLGAGDVDGAQDFYDRTLTMLAGLDADFANANMDSIVEIYLAAGDVYGDDTEKVAQILETGYAMTGENSRVKDKLIENYLQIGKKDTQNGSYEEALTVYDRLLELDSTNTETINDLCDCLNKYIDILMETGRYDEIYALAEKYGDVAVNVDFQTYLDEIVATKKKELLANIPAFDIRDIKIFGYNLLNPHFNEIAEASGYPYHVSFNEHQNYYDDITKLQNGEGSVAIVDGDIFKDFALMLPVDGDFRENGLTTAVSTIGYAEHYYGNEEVPEISLYMRKINGEETDTFRLGESWCDIPISLGDSYEKCRSLLGVDLLIESSFTKEEKSSLFNEELNISYTNQTYTISAGDIDGQNNKIVYLENTYEEDVRKGDETNWFYYDYDMYVSFEMDVEEETVDSFTLTVYFLDGIVQDIDYRFIWRSH